ncbi:MAG TPA: hypothetical protein VKY74_09470 [Chloroflexia bacterium]|nr:hypothetical protein [Chloroflexia bacterium]
MAPSPQRPRCLVLVESSSLRLLVRLILTLEGWDVAELEEAGPPTYQAVIADLDCFVWPGDRGRHAIDQAASYGLPALALTGQDLSRQECAAMGQPVVLLKPFDLATFVGVLHAWRPRLDPLAAPL